MHGTFELPSLILIGFDINTLSLVSGTTRPTVISFVHIKRTVVISLCPFPSLQPIKIVHLWCLTSYTLFFLLRYCWISFRDSLRSRISRYGLLATRKGNLDRK